MRLLFFIHTQEKKDPAQDKKDTTDRRHRPEYAKPCKAKYIEASAEEQDPKEKAQGRGAKPAGRKGAHQYPCGEQGQRVVELVAYCELESIQPPGCGKHALESMGAESPERYGEASHYGCC